MNEQNEIMGDWYEEMNLEQEKMKIKIQYSNDSEPDCRRVGTYTIIDGKEVTLASDCLGSMVDKETEEEARRIFGNNVELEY